jgi:predicted nucleic acid-binding protein
MSRPIPYLLDTNVVLFATRQGGAQAQAIDRQFGLRASPFRPALCEVSVAELLAFAQSWGEARRKLLVQVIDEHVVLPIGRSEIHEQWARLKSHAKSKGLAIQHDHNDIWIAATAHVAGLTVMSTDLAAFLPLRGMLALELLDPRTGIRVP